MRIGLIAPPGVPVPPPAYGGTESVIDRLARGLVRAGHDVLLAAAANSACPVPRVEGTDEAAEAAPVCADTVTELRHVITSYAAMTGVDVVHDHTLTGPLYRRPPAGPPVVTLDKPGADGKSKGCAKASADVIKDIEANPANYYVNVHNAEFGGGAVRGQLSK